MFGEHICLFSVAKNVEVWLILYVQYVEMLGIY
jgi:hypothetical protein